MYDFSHSFFGKYSHIIIRFHSQIWGEEVTGEIGNESEPKPCSSSLLHGVRAHLLLLLCHQ